ncbi:hypothetical protein ABPG72_014583 [Tetrahymena utriculariae]
MEEDLFYKTFLKFIAFWPKSKDVKVHTYLLKKLGEDQFSQSSLLSLKQSFDRFIRQYQFNQDEYILIGLIENLAKSPILVSSESEKYILFIKKNFYTNLLDRLKTKNDSESYLQELDKSLKQFYISYKNDFYNLYLNSQIDIKNIMHKDNSVGEKFKKIDKQISEILKRLNKNELQQQISINQHVQNIEQDQENYNEISNRSNQLDVLLNQIYKSEKISVQYYEDLHEKEIKMVQQIISEMNLKKIIGLENVYAQPYGSLVSGFSQNDSDIDISINTDCYLDERAFLSLVYIFMQNYLDRNKIKYLQLELKTEARIPLITLVKQKENTNLKDQTISIDICINNLLGCANSKMLKVISQAHPLIEKLGIIIKYWAKSNGLISKRNLSSYAFILIMICFLQKKQLIDTYFQDKVKKMQKDHKYFTSIKRKKEDDQEFKTSIYFIQDPSYLQKSLKNYKYKNPNQKTLFDMNLASLFSEFIQYYTDTTDESRRYIDIINDYQYKSYDKNLFFYIIDPFDILHNPGERSKVENIENNIFINGFRLAWQQLQNKQYQEMFIKSNQK